MLQQSPHKSFRAIITRVKPFGIFFDIVDVMVEGFLHVSALEDDYFLYDDSRSQLWGSDTGITYHSGDHIIVSCEGVDIIMQEASWKMIGREESDTKKLPTPKKHKRRRVKK